MGSERGAANIQKFNAQRAKVSVSLIQSEIDLCRKRKLQFKTPGLLASYLSDRTGIHRTTFSRNAKYEGLLAAYMRSQPGAVTSVDDRTDDPYILKAKLAAAHVQIGTLNHEVRRLSAQLSRFPPASQ